MDQNNDELIRKASKRKKDNVGEIQSKHLKKEVKNLKTIKCSLNTFIKSNKQVLLEEIKNNVNILSDLLIETSIYIHFHYNKILQSNRNVEIEHENNRNYFMEFFYHLQKGSKTKYIIDVDYNNIRTKHGLQLYDMSYKSQLMNFAATTYTTVLMNNVQVHMYNRVRRFFKHVQPEINSYSTLKYLFQDEKEDPNVKLLKELKTKLKFDGTFKDLNTKWMSFIPFLYRLQRFREKENVKNFTIFPIFKYGCKHIRYDTTGLHKLLRSIIKTKKLYDENNNEIKIPSNTTEFQLNRDQYWKLFFNVDKFETNTKKFDYSISTNGVDVSLSMNSVKSKTLKIKASKSKIKSTTENEPQNYEKENFKQVIGIDPGLKLMFGAVRDINGKSEGLKIKASKFHYETGKHSRNKKLKRWTQNETKEAYNECQERNISNKMYNYKEFVDYTLKYFKKLQDLYKQRKITRLRFDKYIRTEKMINKYANTLYRKKSTLILVGETKISPNMKGYVRTPSTKIIERLKSYRKVKVKEVDEFRSTMICSKCNNPMNISKSPHRFASCPSCKCVWNRDVNAAINIKNKGLNPKQHENFERSTKIIQSKNKYFVKNCVLCTNSTHILHIQMKSEGLGIEKFSISGSPRF